MFSVIRHHLRSATASDWFITLQTQDELTVSGWIHVAPHRFLLILLPLFGMSLMYKVWFIVILSFLGLVWILRRFTLDLNEYQGLSITYDLFGIKYARKQFPLDIQFQVSLQKLSLESNMPQPQSHTYLYLAHPHLQYRLFYVMNGAYYRVDQLRNLLNTLAVHLQSKRLYDPQPKEVTATHFDEPGEWKLSLIELFPFFLGPRVRIAGQHTFLSWWAPRLAPVLWSVLLLSLLPFISLSSWSIYIGGLSGIGILLCGQRQSLWISPKGIIWEKRMCGLIISYLKWPLHAHTKLFKDLHAPSGRGIAIHLGHRIDHTHFIASPCESSWVYAELQKAIQRAQPLSIPLLHSHLSRSKLSSLSKET
jgi:hypothetical protein